MAFILHIARREAWEEAKSQGRYLAASLATEGFIHCSTIGQVVDTADGFFRGQEGLVLLCIDESRVASPVKYEPPTGGAPHDPAVEPLFPHLYGPLNLDAVIQVVEFPSAPDGTFGLPETMVQSVPATDRSRSGKANANDR